MRTALSFDASSKWQCSCFARLDVASCPPQALWGHQRQRLHQILWDSSERFYFIMLMACGFAKYPIYPDEPGHDLIAWPFFGVKKKKKKGFRKQKASSHSPQILWPSSTHAIQHLGSVIWICGFCLCQHLEGLNQGVFFFFLYVVVFVSPTGPERRELVTPGGEVIHDLHASGSQAAPRRNVFVWRTLALVEVWQ